MRCFLLKKRVLNANPGEVLGISDTQLAFLGEGFGVEVEKKTDAKTGETKWVPIGGGAAEPDGGETEKPKRGGGRRGGRKKDDPPGGDDNTGTTEGAPEWINTDVAVPADWADHAPQARIDLAKEITGTEIEDVERADNVIAEVIAHRDAV